MRVLGIDPGSTVTGLGVIDESRGRYVLVAAEFVRTSSADPIPERLVRIHAAVLGAIDRFAPDVIAIESIFRYKSSESALRLGQARGVALLAAGLREKAVHEYNPSQVKSAVGGHGRADKDGVARMVRLILGCAPDGPADVSDALALAITHCAHARTSALTRRTA